MNNIICKICNEQFKNKRALSAHIQTGHGLTTAWYLAKTEYDEVYPLCPVCLRPRDYRSRGQDFTRFCTEHAHLTTPSKWSEEVKYSEEDLRVEGARYFRENYNPKKPGLPFEPGWKKGLTKHDHPGIAAQAEKMRGDNNPNSFPRPSSPSDRPGPGKGWKKGLTKHDHPGIAAQAEKMRGDKNPSRRLVMAEKQGRGLLLTEEQFDHHRDWIKQNKGFELLATYQEYLESENFSKSKFEFRCTGCDKKQQRPFYTIAYRKTYSRCCGCELNFSQPEAELAGFMASLGVDIVRQDRSLISPRELDIVVPAHKLAVEFHGLYWHSAAVEDNKKYHQEKNDACEKAGVRLIQFFEDEWRDRQDICKSILAHALGRTQNTVYARQCSVGDSLDKDGVRGFFDQNHLAGSTRFSFAVVLKHSGKLVAAMSFRRPFTKNSEPALEIARFAILKHHHIPGGFSKMLKHALPLIKERGARALITYADVRLGLTGKTYEKNGFDFAGTTAIQYWYTDFNIRENRYRYRADRARGLSEKQVAAEAGVYKIWGCANNKYRMCIP